MRTQIIISKSALLSNITQLLRLCGTTALAPVLKSNAYGHGMIQLAQELDNDPRLPLFCVAHDQEALSLRALGIKKPLLTLAFYQEHIKAMIKENIQITIFSIEQWREVRSIARELKVRAYVHLKVDTGMSRLGLTEKEVFNVLNESQTEVIIGGISTHLHDKDALSVDYTFQQLQKFQNVIKKINKPNLITHALSSGALDFSLKFAFSMARVGTHLYGFWSSNNAYERARALVADIRLSPIATWKCSILQIKHITKGTSVGYGRTFIALHDMTIALIPVGYWDGYPRALSNKGIMHIREHPAPVIGIVSMNITALDVSNIPDISYNDEVIIYDQNEISSVERAAQVTHTINIELTTRLHADIPRIMAP